MSPQDYSDTAELLSVLEWYRAAGVDVAVGEIPVDNFAAVAPVRPRTQALAAQIQVQEPALPAIALNADPAEARAIAAAANSLEELRSALEAYQGCPLKFRATQLVFADGNPNASIMLVGEGPGGDEDRIGRPFVGRAGQLLDKMLAAIGLDRTKVYIANTVPWRPPGNRNPTPAEIALCLPFLERQIELVRPRYLVALGAVAAQTLFGTTAGISRLRGQWRDLTVGTHSMRALATLHPAYLLRMPAQKQQAWADLLELQRALAAEISETG